MTILRPTAVRRLTFRLKHRAKLAASDEELPAAYVAAALPGGLDCLGGLFRLDRVSDSRHRNRIFTLEYLARQLSPKLDPTVG